MDFNDYDKGYREGVFDSCNGKPAFYDRAEADGDVFIGGYFDGYDANDARINEPTDSELVERAFNAGAEYANKHSQAAREAAKMHGDFSDDWWDGFYDNL